MSNADLTQGWAPIAASSVAHFFRPTADRKWKSVCSRFVFAERPNISDRETIPEADCKGILYSVKNAGIAKRYPSRAWINSTLARPALRGRCALHICGDSTRADLLAGLLSFECAQVPRIQVNGKLRPEQARQLCDEWPDASIITQHNATNPLLYHLDRENHSLLFDESGGRGQAPAGGWQRAPIPDKAFGYAGGLGPENIQAEAEKIGQLANPGWWVDMEGRLRSPDDWFDVDKARDVLILCRGMKPLGGEFWLHAIHGAVAVLGYRNGHVVGICKGTQRALELRLLEGRLCLRPEGFYLEDPAMKRDTHKLMDGEGNPQ